MTRCFRRITPILVIVFLVVGSVLASAPGPFETGGPEVFVVGNGAYKDVRAAMDAASDGDIIKLSPGVYDKPILVDKGVILVGSPQALITSIMIVNTNSWPLITGHTFLGIWDNATSEGWDAAGIITRQTTGSSPDNSYVNNLRVSSCTFRHCKQGIFLFGAKNSQISSCNFYECYRGITVRGHYIGNIQYWTAYSNSISNCNFYDCVGTGDEDGEAIAIFDSNTNTVTGCTMDGNSYGVYVRGGNQNIITGCTVNGSTYHPMFYENIMAGRVTVTGNTITNNAGNVMFSNCTQFTFNNNDISANGDDVTLYNCAGFTFNSNTIDGSSVLLDRSSTGTFVSNEFTTSDKATFTFNADGKGQYNHNIASSNTVGGNPIYYYYDMTDPVLQDLTVGSIMATYTTGLTVTDCTVLNGDGVWLFNSPQYDVNANVSNCLMGITAVLSDDGVLTGCNVTPSTRGTEGVRLVGLTGSVSSGCRLGDTPTATAWRLEEDSTHDSYGDIFEADRVSASSNAGGILRVHNPLTVKVWDDGGISPYQGADVEVTQDGTPVYQTPFYGGSQPTTDAAGNIHVTLLDREYDHSDTALEHHHNASARVELDEVWTAQANDLDMSRSLLLEFEMSDIIHPMTPSNLAVATIPEEDAIEVTWDANTDDTQVYSLFWDGAGGWTLLGNVTGTSYRIDHGLVHGTEYGFRVSAWDEVPWESGLAGPVTVTHVDGLAPATPTGFQMVTVTGDSITLEWAANTEEDLVGYHLYISETPGGPYTRVSPVAGLTGTTFTVEGLDSETTYYLVLTAFDEVPNESPYTPSLEVRTLDVTPPLAPVLDALPELTNVVTHTLTGEAEPASKVTIFVNGAEAGTTFADPDGTFSFELDLAEGVNTITAWATDAALNTGPLSAAITSLLDTIAPGVPDVEDLPEYTNVASHTLTGTAEIGSTVSIMVDGTEVGTVVTGPDGKFSFDLNLEEGENVITAKARDLAGNVGQASPGITVTLDTEDPEALAGEDITEIEEVEITLDGSGSSDNLGIATYVWTFTLGGNEVVLEDEISKYTFPDPVTLTATLTVTDLAGNTASDDVEIVIVSKNLPPTLRDGLMDPEKGNTKTDFTFTVTFTDPDGDNGEVWVVIDGESYLMTPDPDDTDTSDGQTYTYVTKLTKGEHVYWFRGKDSAGHDAGGPSAGDANSKSSPDVAEYKTESSPGGWGAGVLLAVAAIALVASMRRRRR